MLSIFFLNWATAYFLKLLQFAHMYVCGIATRPIFRSVALSLIKELDTVFLYVKELISRLLVPLSACRYVRAEIIAI